MLKVTAWLLIAGWAPNSFAQGVTIQQPVVSTFGVNTAVSVPDRGEVLLGGISSAADTRNTFGPFRSGTSSGLRRSAGNASVRVWIHDPDSMDQTLLMSVDQRVGPLTEAARLKLSREILLRKKSSY